MNETHESDPTRRLRQSLYWILIAAALGQTVARVVATNSVDRVALEKHFQRKGRTDWKKTRPFLSANDRSRWCTIRALVEQGTYAIDDIQAEENWDTIDMVKHVDRDGKERLYSSKPTLLPTLIAGPYWILHKLTGETLGTQPHLLGKPIVLLVIVLPLLVLWVCVAKLADRFGTSDWGRLIVVVGATWGTLLNPFAIVLNNHIVAASATAVAAYLMAGIWCDGDRRWSRFFLTGLAVGFAAANELPATALIALVGMALLWIAPQETWKGFLPGVLLVAAGFFGTNWVAHNSWLPPYCHRDADDPAKNWYKFTYEREGEVRTSFWDKPRGIDSAKVTTGEHVFHVLVGHHGVFSLTPLWLLSFAGMGVWWWRSPAWRAFGPAVAALSLVVVGFYLFSSSVDRNFGGTCCGYRWLIWLAPLWLIAMLPAVDRLSLSRGGRVMGWLALAASAFSASFPTWNPWTHPWILQAMLKLGWIEI